MVGALRSQGFPAGGTKPVLTPSGSTLQQNRYLLAFQSVLGVGC